MSQSDRAYSEKRDFIRMRLESPVTLYHEGRAIPAVCLDLSSTGMQIEADCILTPGDKVKVQIASEHNELKGLEAQAEVVRIVEQENGRKSIGLAILSMS
ncbi:PilZ domain-containing protein [Pseudomonas sp. LRF_L74]|uniref:PilZ domain-containing protein n=1 Tax=Pseudomonas sp. LRF_L74 TaxID=3369422 RepID=UPI003F5DCB89